MINQNFVIIGALLNVFGSLSYLIATVRGKVKPNRITWFLWGFAPLLAFAAEVKQDVGLQSLMTFMVGFNSFLIFLASFVNKKSYWKLGLIDIVCGIFSVVGLFLWYVTKIGNTAIIFSILADGLAGYPTLVKSYNAPKTENYIVFIFSGVSAMLTLLTVKIWNFANFGFPLYMLLLDILFFVVIKYKLGKLTKATGKKNKKNASNI